jgi:hypothetical protein
MRDHKVSRRKMISAMYKKQLGETTLETRELQKSMVGPKYETSKVRPSNYRTGDFMSHMLSPFTSLKWLDKAD